MTSCKYSITLKRVSTLKVKLTVHCSHSHIAATGTERTRSSGRVMFIECDVRRMRRYRHSAQWYKYYKIFFFLLLFIKASASKAMAASTIIIIINVGTYILFNWFHKMIITNLITLLFIFYPVRVCQQNYYYYSVAGNLDTNIWII